MARASHVSPSLFSFPLSPSRLLGPTLQGHALGYAKGQAQAQAQAQPALDFLRLWEVGGATRTLVDGQASKLQGAREVGSPACPLTMPHSNGQKEGERARGEA